MPPEPRPHDSADDLLNRICRGDRERFAPILVVAAHPDDEVAGMGSLLLRFFDSLFILHVTDGSPRDRSDARASGFRTRREYARARRRELRAALSLAGIGPKRCGSLQFTDQESAFHLDEISLSIADILEKERFGMVFSHPYEGGHPDHDSAAFAVRTATRLMERRGIGPPALLEFSSYHGDGPRLLTSTFLPFPGVTECTIHLSPGERDLKQRMIDCFVTQKKTLAQFHLSPERYRAAPNYDFSGPPHEGVLLYEQFPWGMTGKEWRDRAGMTLEALDVR